LRAVRFARGDNLASNTLNPPGVELPPLDQQWTGPRDFLLTDEGVNMTAIDHAKLQAASQILRTAIISPCGLYRYSLGRRWHHGDARPHYVMWLMLNPSTADGETDDRTIERCISFSRSWGFDGLMVGNLFAFRATDPKMLYRAEDAVGPANDAYLQNMATGCELVVAAWGGHDYVYPERVRAALLAVGRPVKCLGTTKGGHPRHPLYLKSDTVLTEYKRA
jgi:hypothetical protein